MGPHLARALIYITLENSIFQTKDDDFHAAVAKTLEEACKLVEDCDDVKLRRIFDGIAIMQKEFPELRKEKFLIVLSSPFNFSIASFPRISWNRYMEMVWYAVDRGIEHDGHAFYAASKGYGVLRTGAQYGITPRILYSLGDRVGCKKCMKEFREDIEQWK